MQKLESLRSATSLASLADLLEFKVSALTFLLYKLPAANKYRTFSIPKRSGGTRTISAPDKRLKGLQKKVSTLFHECLAEIEGDLSSPAHGFKLKRSIFTNAAQHCGRRYVFNIDLKDFFPSIHFGRITGYLEKSRHFGLDPVIARSLANILCHEAKLPQGAPSSPVVSNLLARMLDIHLARLAKRHRLTYTRYADDLTFSTNLRIFPEAVAKQTSDHEWTCGEDLISIIESGGFRINDRKTRMLYAGSRQEVTGLVVNDKVSVPLEYRRWARAAVTRLVKTGEHFDPPPKNFIGPLSNKPIGGSLNRLEGCLSHIYNAHRFRRTQSAKGKATKDTVDDLHSDELVYRKFLHYVKFFRADKPVIVCEGETDSIYIASAISVLGTRYPTLINAALKGGESDRHKIRFFKHTNVADRILSLNGGTDTLKHFCRIYVDQSKKFLSGAPTNPLLIIVDSDNAGRDVINYAKGIARNQGFAEKDFSRFVFVRPNIYVLWIPCPASEKNFVIENLFPDDLLKKQLGDKVLTLSNGKAGHAEFSKMYFAKYIVPKAEAKDFEGFLPLLDRMVEVISDFEGREKLTPINSDNK